MKSEEFVERVYISDCGVPIGEKGCLGNERMWERSTWMKEVLIEREGYNKERRNV